MIEKITEIINAEPDNEVDVSSAELWLNNSDGDGEDLQAESVKFDNGVLGVEVGDGDFFALEELDEDELEMVYEAVFNNAESTKEEREDKARDEIRDIINNAWSSISSIASERLGIELDYETCDYIEELVMKEIDIEFSEK